MEPNVQVDLGFWLSHQRETGSHEVYAIVQSSDGNNS